MQHSRIAVIGGGNIGVAIARGLARTGGLDANDITVTRRTASALESIATEKFSTTADNLEAVRTSTAILLCVQPAHAAAVAHSLSDALDPERHVLISVVTGVSVASLDEAVGHRVPVVRAMPNTAVARGESMTCIAEDPRHEEAVASCAELFDRVGATAVIPENSMTQATALCACGIAFFLRAIRAASQGGIEIGFHAEEALAMAAQTARGAAALLGEAGRHPEGEIDRVTTPMGCTIAGLNQMEHEGFSSALIKGIVTSAQKASKLGDEA